MREFVSNKDSTFYLNIKFILFTLEIKFLTRLNNIFLNWIKKYLKFNPTTVYEVIYEK